MPSTATWNLLSSTPATPDVQIEDPAAQAAASFIFLGNGLLRPFQRDGKADFANASGPRLVRSAVGQILGTRCSSARSVGELPWRPEFGSLLYVLRHSNNDDELKQIAAAAAVEALRRWEPRVSVTGFDITQRSVSSDLDAVEVVVRYNIIDRNVPGNNVIVGGQQTTIEFEVGAQ